ncbi:MAG: hypothetical protein ACE5EA_09950 [Nitrospirota bacterium]
MNIYAMPLREIIETTFIVPLKKLGQNLFHFFPNILSIIIIIFIGIVTGWLTMFFIVRFLNIIDFEKLSNRIGLSQSLKKSGIKDRSTVFIGRIFYWIIFVIFLMIGLSILHLEPIDNVINQFFTYIPNIIAGFLILLLGYIFSNFIARGILIASVNADIKAARYIAKAARIAVLIFALSMALEQLGIAQNIVVATFSIAFGGVILALSIAFGLGGRDIARDFLEKKCKRESGEEKVKEDNISHL